MATLASTWAPPLPEAPGFEHLVVETPGLRSHLATIGEGDPVVLLHGCPQHWWQWHAIAPVIAAHGYRVYCPDLRGAGWTVADDPRIGRETRLRDLLALLDALDVERAHLLSHDMGVITAMQLTYDHPERVRTAVQLAVWPGFVRFHPRLVPAFQHLPKYVWHRPGAPLRGDFSERYVARPMSEATIEAHLAPMQRPEVDAAVRPLARGMVLPEALRIMRGAYRSRRLTVPTLVVFGRRDHPTTEELMGRICRDPERYADHVEFAYVDDAAHFITDDAPAAVADLSLDWFDRAAR
ncbi:alpha/beta hydrolase [Cellulosimicrobium sp. Marseille-Q4280]|uniref:alpha/beta fold hydrolase n=1 Tax=Cellulosimicrobium sp. Marseille-Q4280 TaxID=2937992 RepID=UPI002041F23A|nr:alpha/beta hydrolase [Cellulosimicrobium sp. Marseille-Q4280]